VRELMRGLELSLSVTSSRRYFSAISSILRHWTGSEVTRGVSIHTHAPPAPMLLLWQRVTPFLLLRAESESQQTSSFLNPQLKTQRLTPVPVPVCSLSVQ
jgi:hypothetical protein